MNLISKFIVYFFDDIRDINLASLREESLKIVELSCLFIKDIYNDVEVIHEYPGIALSALNSCRISALQANEVVNLVSERCHMCGGSTGNIYIEIGNRRLFSYIKKRNIDTLLLYQYFNNRFCKLFRTCVFKFICSDFVIH